MTGTLAAPPLASADIARARIVSLIEVIRIIGWIMLDSVI
jgi:hypothetical protein